MSHINRINPVNTSTFIVDIIVFRLCNDAHNVVNLRSLVLCIEVVYISYGNIGRHLVATNTDASISTLLLYNDMFALVGQLMPTNIVSIYDDNI